MKYDMSSFLEQCVQRYLELGSSRITSKLKYVDTPFLDEGKPEFDENPAPKGSSSQGGIPTASSPRRQGGQGVSKSLHLRKRVKRPVLPPLIWKIQEC